MTPPFLDFATVTPPRSPNWVLVAPSAQAEQGLRRRESPIFDDPPARLCARLADALASLPRTRVTGMSEDGCALEAEARSRVFRFVDRISARAVSAPESGSALWLYSRAMTGYADLGVNAKRVAALMRALGVARWAPDPSRPVS